MIEVKNLTKRYADQLAVDTISFDVQKGEIVGFLGPNGAGKTTTMKMLTCYMPPESGTVTIDGFDVETHSFDVRKKIGYLPENAPLYMEMGVFDYISFIAEVRHIPKGKRMERIKEVVRICGLKGVIHKDIGELSKGYRQRLCLAQAIVHDPDILILDEPTSGLDPNQIVEIRTLIRELGREKTVILSTHILSEVQATCSRVLIINEGKIVANGTPEQLQDAASGRDEVVIKVKGPQGAILGTLQSLDGVIEVKQADLESADIGTYRVWSEKGKDIRETLFHGAVANNLVLLEMKKEVISLEAIFRKLTSN